MTDILVKMNFLAWISIIIISWALVATWKYIVQNTALEPRNLPEMVDQSFASLSAACGQDEPEITQRPIDRKESPNETSSPSHQKTQTDAPSPHEPKAECVRMFGQIGNADNFLAKLKTFTLQSWGSQDLGNLPSLNSVLGTRLELDTISALVR